MAARSVADWTREDYERSAQEYLASLPLEHFMESVGQATQRKITLASLGVVEARRPGFRVCNELLVQYLLGENGNGEGADEGPGRVVPDNMVVFSTEPLAPMSSLNTRFEEVEIFWVLEYVSRSNRRKDYEENFRKYGEELKVPYYLLFDPDRVVLKLYRHNGTGYDEVAPNEHGRLALPEVEVEVGLVDGWARFWYQGLLVPLPEELLAQMDELQEELRQARERVVEADKAAALARANEEKAKKDAELARENEEKAKKTATQAREEATQARANEGKATRDAELAREAAEKAKKDAEQEREQARLAREALAESERQAKEARDRAAAVELEAAQMRLLIQRLQAGQPPEAAP